MTLYYEYKFETEEDARKFIEDLKDSGTITDAKADTLCGSDILVKAIKNGIRHETVTEFADRCRECGREKVLDKIRSELHATAEMHEDGDYYLRDEWIDEIINKYKAESEEQA